MSVIKNIRAVFPKEIANCSIITGIDIYTPHILRGPSQKIQNDSPILNVKLRITGTW